MSLQLATPFPAMIRRLDRAAAGGWAVSGSDVATEIMASAGFDWLLIDMEHSANSVATIQHQLQICSAYPVTPVVRVPSNDPVAIKRILDIGAQNLCIPMVNSAAEARTAVTALRYPPRGVRGVGSALARSSRWNRVPNYLGNAEEHSSLTVQIESIAAVGRASDIASVDGVDAAFIGPADLAAAMGLLGNAGHEDVIAAVEQAITNVRAADALVGVNAFDPVLAERYIAAGAHFVALGADVSLLASSSTTLARRFTQMG